MSTQNPVEVIIVGGSSAGLSAALTLGRARRQVMVVDDGKPRNVRASNSYGFYTRDGTPPAELNRLARAELAPYDVVFRDNHVMDITRNGNRFDIMLDDGTILQTGKLLLATGIADELNDIPGLLECWGRSAYSCPYCDGWEMRDKKLVVVAENQGGYHFALSMLQWSKNITLCTNGHHPHEHEQRAYLEKCGVTLAEKPLARLEHIDGELHSVIFGDGSELACDGLFTHPACHLRDNLSRQLGCALVENGNHLVVDDEGRTTVPGVYAAGDIAAKHSQIAIASASGVLAAFAINDDLMRELHG